MSAPNFQPGVYGVKITSQEFGQSGTGTPQFRLGFSVYSKRDDPEGKSWTQIEPQDAAAYFYFTDKSASISIGKLKVLGFVLPAPRFELLDQNTAGFVDMIGQEVLMECKIETFNDQQVSKWDTVYLGAQPCEENKLRNLNAMFGKNFLDESGTQPQPQSSAHTNPDGSQEPMIGESEGF